MASPASFLYKVIAVIEIVCAGVIIIFGVNTFLLFNQMDDEFQKEKEMIYYSSIVSVVQSILSIFASILLIGCYFRLVKDNVEQNASPSQKRVAQLAQHNSLKQKAIAPTWIAWTLISLASLLFVFIAPIHYCIQSQEDKDKLERLTLKDGYYETVDHKHLGMCHSDSPELIPLRNSLGDLYSFSFIGIMFKTLFIILVYRNWRKQVRRGRKIMIYVHGCESSANEPGCDTPSSPTTDLKLAASSASPSSSTTGAAGTTSTGVNENGGGGDATNPAEKDSSAKK